MGRLPSGEVVTLRGSLGLGLLYLEVGYARDVWFASERGVGSVMVGNL